MGCIKVDDSRKLVTNRKPCNIELTGMWSSSTWGNSSRVSCAMLQSTSKAQPRTDCCYDWVVNKGGHYDK
jgi:hypothetical protein